MAQMEPIQRRIPHPWMLLCSKSKLRALSRSFVYPKMRHHNLIRSSTMPTEWFRILDHSHCLVLDAGHMQTVSSSRLSTDGLLLILSVTAVLEVGVKLSYEESQSHFSLWAIVSSPLILGFDLTNETVLQSVWNIITNEETLNVSQTWYSKGTYPSGRLVRNSSNYFNATIEHVGCLKQVRHSHTQ